MLTSTRDATRSRLRRCLLGRNNAPERALCVMWRLGVVPRSQRHDERDPKKRGRSRISGCGRADASIPAIPPPVHTDDGIREWFASVVVPDRDLWIITHDDLPVALLVLDDGWVNQLYVDPQWTGRGLGSVLIGLAKERSPKHLDLWAFQSNIAALRFYERHGFVSIGTTDGENEERAPDVHYRWSNP